MSRKISTNQIATGILIVLLIAFGAYFLYNIFTSIIRPLYLTEEKDTQSVLLDTSLTEAIEYLKKREALRAGIAPERFGIEDLTGSTPSATLTNTEEKILTAEIINGSGVPGAARDLADKLKLLGISVSQISNSSIESASTVVLLKIGASSLRDAIVEKIGTKSAEIRFEVLAQDTPFDIRILIGK